MIHAYPVRGKQKSFELCEAFVRGAKASDGINAAVFYGVDDSNQDDWNRVRASGMDWFYIDNAYFDVTRSAYFRITRNALQHTGRGASNGSRFRALRLKLKPWRKWGRHIVLCEQSDDFMRRMVGYKGSWLEDTKKALSMSTSREFRVRRWQRDKIMAMSTLEDDLEEAWALVTHSSAAAITALIHGIPIFSEAGAAATMSPPLSQIEDPFFPDGRESFLGVLADNQWTIAEMRSGYAWGALTGQ